jgi:hypothetical protein
MLFPVLGAQHPRHRNDLHQHRAEVPIDGPHQPVALRLVADAEGVLQIVHRHETMAAIDLVDQPRQPARHLPGGAEGQRLQDAHDDADRKIDGEISRLGTRFGHGAAPLALDSAFV